MHIILLSGGSGKRLWPISNNIRSKQFIRLLKNERGEFESMLQRVYRQITTFIPGATVTITAGRPQINVIRDQLGEDISICIEPNCRDTFPAIILAASYLKDVLKVEENECIIVCPVDSFVGEEFFEGLKELEELVKFGTANLTLMGIRPESPLEKFGYIVPYSEDVVSKVKEFKEKPDKSTAEQCIKQGALWNMGVFAFQLGYLLEKARKTYGFLAYSELQGKYHDLEKISFDYAVVEKESNIQVLRYSGAWKDIGTWKMITQVMGDQIKGNVTLDRSCNNVNVINELNIPILCMGCNDMVIAASQEGILVADKDQSDHMKPYVDEIEMGANCEEKAWGNGQALEKELDSVVVRLFLVKGTQLKYCSHEGRKKIYIVLSGQGKMMVDGVEQVLRIGDIFSAMPGKWHTISAETNMNIIEVKIGEANITDEVVYSHSR